MAVQFAELGAAGQSQKTFDNAYREWEIQSRVIGSRLRAYFPDNSIGPDWNTYCESVTDFYALTGIDDVSRRKERLSKIKIGVSAAESSPDWDVLALRNQLFREQAEEEAYRKSEEEWGKLRQHMFARKDELIQRVLNSRISGF